METRRDGSITLSSRAREILAEAGEYVDEDGEEHLPRTIAGAKVWGIAGEYVLGEALVPVDDDAVLSVAPGDEDHAAAWLRAREFHRQPGFERAWAQIRAHLTRRSKRPS